MLITKYYQHYVTKTRKNLVYDVGSTVSMWQDHKLGERVRWFNYLRNDVADKLLTRGEQQYASEFLDLSTGLADGAEIFAMFSNWNCVNP